ncbi:MAG TPA: hypothetical protein VFD67_00095 [Gemmatimonadaceae bacterium]|nr:hypothetical protein [Gemmatimonadaceae bacterium]
MSLTLALLAMTQGPMEGFPPGIFPHELVAIIQSFFITVGVIALGIPIIRALTRRFVDRPPVAPQLAADVENRLERIEQAVEAVAIEVERISESQRYLTKLMAEPRALPGNRGSANA